MTCDIVFAVLLKQEPVIIKSKSTSSKGFWILLRNGEPSLSTSYGIVGRSEEPARRHNLLAG